jgi:hypothetical protein
MSSQIRPTTNKPRRTLTLTRTRTHPGKRPPHHESMTNSSYRYCIPVSPDPESPLQYHPPQHPQQHNRTGLADQMDTRDHCHASTCAAPGAVLITPPAPPKPSQTPHCPRAAQRQCELPPSPAYWPPSNSDLPQLPHPIPRYARPSEPARPECPSPG